MNKIFIPLRPSASHWRLKDSYRASIVNCRSDNRQLQELFFTPHGHALGF